MADISLNPVTPVARGILVGDANPLPVQVVGGSVSRILTPTIVAGSGAKITGDTNEHIAAYINVLGGLMGAKGVINFAPLIDNTSVGGGNVLAYLRIIAGTSAGTLAGSTLINGVTMGAVTSRYRSLWAVYNTAENAQASFPGATGSGSTSGAITTAAIDTASAFTISINLKLSNGTDSTWMAALDATLNPRT